MQQQNFDKHHRPGNINKAYMYHKKLPAVPSKSDRAQSATHAVPEMYSMKSSNKLIKKTIIPTDNPKTLTGKQMMKN